MKTTVSLTTDERRLLARKYDVSTRAQFARVQDLLVRLKKAKAQVALRVKAVKDPLNQARAAVLALEKDLMTPLDVRIGEVTFAIQAYRDATAAQARAAVQAEADAKAARLREAAASAAPAVAQALEKAAETLTAADPTPPPLTGLHEVDKWRGDVGDFAALVRSVADGKAPLDTLAAVPAKCDALAEQYKTLLSEVVPGLVPRKERDLRRNAR